MRRNNLYRARKIAAVLKKWHGDKWADDKTRVADALADLRHLCDLRSLNKFHELDELAYEHYTEEIHGGDDPNFVNRKRAK